MKNKQITANKDCLYSGLYGLAFLRLKECQKIRGAVIRFPIVFEKICRSYQIPKSQAWELLRIFQDLGLIKIVAGHGVIIQDGKRTN